MRFRQLESARGAGLLLVLMLSGTVLARQAIVPGEPTARARDIHARAIVVDTPGSVTGPAAVTRALRLIDRVRESVKANRNHLVLATTVADIRRAASQRKIAALLGMEGGHMIAEDLGVLRVYAALGVRYLTLTHSENTTWADSSGGKPQHDGLTAFGEDVVRELNRLGVMVDISHVADTTFYDTLAVTRAPVIASRILRMSPSE